MLARAQAARAPATQLRDQCAGPVEVCGHAERARETVGVAGGHLGAIAIAGTVARE